METKVKYLIVNADDFGMSREVNEGIKEGIKAKVITSVSLMVNMPYFDDAVKFLTKHPEVAIGLHFNITEGSSSLPPKSISTLLREDNNFYYWTVIIFKMFRKQVSYPQITGELKEQFSKLQKTGLKISHIDSHHHIHLMPTIFSEVLSFAKKNKVDTLRCKKFNILNLTNGIRKRPTIKQMIIITLCFINNIRNYRASHLFGFDSMYDLDWSKNLTESDLQNILAHLPAGVNGFICHPAVMSENGNRLFLEPRFHCLQLLLHPSFKKQIMKHNIQLISHKINRNKY